MRETKEGVTTLFRSGAIEEHRITAQGVNALLRNVCEILGRAIIDKGGRVLGIWGTLKTGSLKNPCLFITLVGVHTEGYAITASCGFRVLDGTQTKEIKVTNQTWSV